MCPRGSLGFFDTSGMNAVSGPPDVRVTVGGASVRGDGVVYEVRAHNRGGQLAENVEIEVTAGQETRTLVVAAIEENDQETGAVVFPPGTPGSPKAQVRSYVVAGR